MRIRQVLFSTVAAIGIAAMAATVPDPLAAQQSVVAIDKDDIGGVVAGPGGPEAGVWVIAETTDLPTKYAKIVVTDDQGRYVVPDLPTANYQVWVRGFGLVDSPKMRAKPGQQLDLTAVPAPDARSAAQYYPAIYWYAMMQMPPAKDFGGSSDIPKDSPASSGASAWATSTASAATSSARNRHGTSRRSSASSSRARRPGRAASPRAIPASGWSTASPASSAACRSSITASGPTASRRANCRRTSRRGRKASSAMSSSPRGSGAARRPSSTT